MSDDSAKPNTVNDAAVSEETLLFSFGIVADVQYADIENLQNYEKSAWRYYRESINVLNRAVDKWNSSPVPVSFLLQLGDLIDGFNTLSNSSDISLKKVLQVLARFKGHGGVHHTWGNHEFYNFSRECLLLSPLNSNPDKEAMCSYYSFSPRQGFRFVVMDTYDVALIGFDKESSEYKEALGMIEVKNKNENLNSPDGLIGLDRRFCMVNGGVSKAQLAWLEDTLAMADLQEESVVVIGHIPLYQPSTYPFCMLWNYDEVLEVFHRHACVATYLAGHDHIGGYAVDEHGIHHVTVRGVIEAGIDTEDPTITAHVYNNRMELYNLGPRSKPIEKVTVELKRPSCHSS